LRRYTIASIVVIEPNQNKRNIAMQLGATLTLDPNDSKLITLTNQAVNYMGYDYVIEASGDSNMLQFGFSCLSKMGTLLVYSMYNEDPAFNMLELYFKEAKIISSYMPTNSIPTIEAFLPHLDSNLFINKIYSIDQVEEAFQAHLIGSSPRVVIQM
jgi:Zn-dependent alcohol dehydrogenase